MKLQRLGGYAAIGAVIGFVLYVFLEIYVGKLTDYGNDMAKAITVSAGSSFFPVF